LLRSLTEAGVKRESLEEIAQKAVLTRILDLPIFLLEKIDYQPIFCPGEILK
jgi:hypothetical protein